MKKLLVFFAAAALSAGVNAATWTGTCTFNDYTGGLSGSLSTGGGGGGGDTTAPTVSLTAPSNGATVSGSITLAATASDNVGVSSVQFKVDGVNRGTADTSSPYSRTWDTTGVSDGSHTVSATAVDTSGNTATDSHTVTVQNQTGGGTSPNDTTIPPASQIVDSDGHVWTVANGDGHSDSVYRDGSFTGGWDAVLVLYHDGELYLENDGDDWYIYDGSPDWTYIANGDAGDPRLAGGGGGGGSACNTLQTIYDDMTLPADASINNPFDNGAQIETGNNPPSWANALAGWGTVQHDATESGDTNTAVEVRNFRVYIHYGDGDWQQLKGTSNVGYSGYTQDYSGSAELENCHAGGGGGTQCKIPHGAVFHFWPAGDTAASIQTSGIDGILVAYQARLVLNDQNGPDDRDSARYLGDAGADYYGNGKCCGEDGGEVGAGRSKFLSDDWKWFNFTTVPAANIQSSSIPLECDN
jgi:hypothetical protein